MLYSKTALRSLLYFVLAMLLSVGGTQAQSNDPLDESILETFKWRSIGPANISGRVTDVEGLPHPSKTYYVATATSGIWKTTNNGTTFESIWENERVVSMGDLAIAPSDPNLIWAGTGEEDSRNSISAGGGIFKSTDAGKTWKLMGLKETQTIGRIVVHPTNPDVVYVAALGHIWGTNPERGLYKTTDGGETWELSKFISEKAGFVDVIMHPKDPDVLWAASWERQRGPYFLNSGGPGSALWKTEDAGKSWTEVTGNGFPTAMKGRIGLAISQSYPKIMYAMVEAEKEEDESGGSGLYRSADGGESWEKMNDVNTRPFYYSQVRVDPSDPDRVYFSSTPLQFSDDGGKTYGTTTNGIHVDHHAMWIDPEDPDRVIVGNDGGVAITFDRGGNWITFNNVATGQFYAVSYNMEVPYRVCGGLQDNGLWCGPSRLASGNTSKYHWADIHFGDGFVSMQDPEDPDLVWTETQGGNMARQNLATGERTTLEKPNWEKAWRPLQDSIIVLMEQGVAEDAPQIQNLREQASADSAANVLRWNWNTPYFQSTHDRSHFYAGSNVVLKSTAWGDSLAAISPDLTYADPEKIKVSSKTTGGVTPDLTGAETYATIVSLAESPLQQGLLYAGTDDGRVWMSSNDGGEWTELTDNIKGVPEGTYVSRITPSHHSTDRFYITYDNHRVNDFAPYVFATDNGGRRFRSIASDLPSGSLDYIHVIVEDPRNENLLFVGTDLGVYVSANRGENWQRFMVGLPTVPVHDLKIHPRDRELIAGTHGRAIWIVDIAPLQDLTQEILATDATILEPKPAFQFGQRTRGGESYGQAWFARPTPGAVGSISYYIGSDAAEAVAADSAKAREMRREAAEADTSEGKPRMIPPRKPEITLTITDAEGDTVQTLNGPAAAGLHTITWDLRGKRAATEMSPSQLRDAAKTAERAKFVADSLITAGWNESIVKRLTGLFTGETDFMAMVQAFMGNRPTGDPEAFKERPGESQSGSGAASFGNFGQIREIAELVMPGQGLSSLFNRFQASGGSAPLVDAGNYTLTLEIGAHSATQSLSVERIGHFDGETAPFSEKQFIRLLKGIH